MGFRVNTNVDALKAYQQLANANKMTSNSQLRLASGKRINSVADDTSGFNIGTSLKGKVAVFKGAQSNIASAKNLLSTAEGSLLGVNDLLTKIEGKLSDSANVTADRTALKDDIQSIANEINSILTNTKFNDTQLLVGTTADKGFEFQVGEAGDNLTLNFASTIASSAANGMGATTSNAIQSFVNIAASTLESTGATGQAANLAGMNSILGTLKDQVSDALGDIGNFTQRLDIKNDNLNVAIVNAESSISRLFDADMAMEQLNATKGSILQQSATAMFSQLNFAPQQVLQLFG